MHVSPDQVLITTGSQQGLDLLAKGDRFGHHAAAISLAECRMKLGDMRGSRELLAQVLPDLRARIAALTR